jgi:hypothetical protein
MTPRDFCYWLRGKLDETGADISAGDLDEIYTRLSECLALLETPMATIPAGTKPVASWLDMNKSKPGARNQWSKTRFGKMKGLGDN